VQQSTCVVTGQEPNGIIDYTRIDATPEVLGAVLAALGLTVLSQLIVVSGRRRRRDFAVLRAPTAAVPGQLDHGLAGEHAGRGRARRWAAARDRCWPAELGDVRRRPWRASPRHYAGAAGPVVVPVVILAANAVAFWRGRKAARVRAAEVLRTE